VSAGIDQNRSLISQAQESSESFESSGFSGKHLIHCELLLWPVRHPRISAPTKPNCLPHWMEHTAKLRALQITLVPWPDLAIHPRLQFRSAIYPAHQRLQQCTKILGTALYRNSNSANQRREPKVPAIGASNRCCSDQTCVHSPISNALRGRLELTLCLHQTGHYRRRRHNRTPPCPVRGPGRCQFTTRTYLIPKSQVLLGFLRYRKGSALQPCAQEEAEEEAGRP
jgi:hypothetical protein